MHLPTQVASCNGCGGPMPGRQPCQGSQIGRSVELLHWSMEA